MLYFQLITVFFGIRILECLPVGILSIDWIQQCYLVRIRIYSEEFSRINRLK